MTTASADVKSCGGINKFVTFTHQENFEWAHIENSGRSAVIYGKVFAVRDGYMYYKWQLKILTKRAVVGDDKSSEEFSVFFYWISDVEEGTVMTERLSFAVEDAEGNRKEGTGSAKPLLFNNKGNRGWGWEKCFDSVAVVSNFRSGDQLCLEVKFTMNKRQMFDPSAVGASAAGGGLAGGAVAKTEPQPHSILSDFFANIEDRKESGGNFRIVAADTTVQAPAQATTTNTQAPMDTAADTADEAQQLQPSTTVSDNNSNDKPRVFFANTAVLKRKSDRLARMFDSDEWLENETGVMKATFSGAALHEMLRFVYTDAIGATLCDSMPDVLDGAEDWGLTALKLACQQQMIARVVDSCQANRPDTCDIAVDYLIAADRYKLTTLKKVCINILVGRLTQFLRSPKCIQLMTDGNTGSELVEEVTDTASQLLIPYSQGMKKRTHGPKPRNTGTQVEPGYHMNAHNHKSSLNQVVSNFRTNDSADADGNPGVRKRKAL